MSAAGAPTPVEPVEGFPDPGSTRPVPHGFRRLPQRPVHAPVRQLPGNPREPGGEDERLHPSRRTMRKPIKEMQQDPGGLLHGAADVGEDDERPRLLPPPAAFEPHPFATRPKSPRRVRRRSRLRFPPGRKRTTRRRAALHPASRIRRAPRAGSSSSRSEKSRRSSASRSLQVRRANGRGGWSSGPPDPLPVRGRNVAGVTAERAFLSVIPGRRARDHFSGGGLPEERKGRIEELQIFAPVRQQRPRRGVELLAPENLDQRQGLRQVQHPGGRDRQSDPPQQASEESEVLEERWKRRRRVLVPTRGGAQEAVAARRVRMASGPLSADHFEIVPILEQRPESPVHRGLVKRGLAERGKRHGPVEGFRDARGA